MIDPDPELKNASDAARRDFTLALGVSMVVIPVIYILSLVIH